LKQLILVGALFCCAIVSGCGGGSGGAASCGALEPCGGDPVGTWKLTGGCFDDAIVTMSYQEATCASATATAKITSSAGTVQFKADRTYVVTGFMASTVVTVDFPATCLNGITCADIQSTFRASPSTASATCTGTSTCQCMVPLQGDTTSESGTYVINGTSLDTTPSDGSDPDTISYCVKGNTLHLIELDTTMNMGPMGQATIVADLLATKQ